MMYTDLKEELITTWFLMDAEKINQVQLFLQEESKLMTVQTPIRAIFRCQDLRSALRLLEKWSVLSPQRVDVLGKLAELTDCHPVMVREKLDQYKKLNLPPTVQDDYEPWQQQAYHQSNHYAPLEDPSLYLPPRETLTTHTTNNNLFTPQENVQPDSIYMEIIEYLSVNMRDQWKDVGRKLGLHNRVAELMHSPGRQKDKVIEMFTEYYDEKRENALTSILDALKDCRLNRQRDHIINRILGVKQ